MASAGRGNCGIFCPATATCGAEEVIHLNRQTAIVIISAATLVVAFAALVLKIIEVARSK